MKGEFVILKQDKENKLSETFSTNQIARKIQRLCYDMIYNFNNNFIRSYGLLNISFI